MASYIGQVQIDSGATSLVGSSLYGICNSAASATAKTVLSADASAITLDTSNTKFINNNFDTLLQGITIHVKFIQGNTATDNLTLQVGSTAATTIIGKCTCDAGTIISFTLDEQQRWVVNDNVDTNTEYVFKTAYNASTNRVLGEADVGDAAEKDIVTTLSDGDNNTTNSDLPTATAVVQYVLNKTAGLSGLTGAMHFKGAVAAIPPASGTYESGDVVLGPNNKEYVYNGTTWIELGDEGSYVLQTSQTTDVIDEVTNWNDGTLPELTVTDTPVSNVSITTAGVAAQLTPQQVTVPNVTQAGTATTASVTGGVLNITTGQNTTLGTDVTFDAIGSWTTNTPTVVSATPVTVGSASGWSAGTKPTLTQTPTTVVVPVTTTP